MDTLDAGLGPDDGRVFGLGLRSGTCCSAHRDDSIHAESPAAAGRPDAHPGPRRHSHADSGARDGGLSAGNSGHAGAERGDSGQAGADRHHQPHGDGDAVRRRGDGGRARLELHLPRRCPRPPGTGWGLLAQLRIDSRPGGRPDLDRSPDPGPLSGAAVATWSSGGGRSRDLTRRRDHWHQARRTDHRQQRGGRTGGAGHFGPRRLVRRRYERRRERPDPDLGRRQEPICRQAAVVSRRRGVDAAAVESGRRAARQRDLPGFRRCNC